MRLTEVVALITNRKYKSKYKMRNVLQQDDKKDVENNPCSFTKKDGREKEKEKKKMMVKKKKQKGTWSLNSLSSYSLRSFSSPSFVLWSFKGLLCIMSLLFVISLHPKTIGQQQQQQQQQGRQQQEEQEHFVNPTNMSSNVPVPKESSAAAAIIDASTSKKSYDERLQAFRKEFQQPLSMKQQRQQNGRRPHYTCHSPSRVMKDQLIKVTIQDIVKARIQHDHDKTILKQKTKNYKKDKNRNNNNNKNNIHINYIQQNGNTSLQNQRQTQAQQQQQQQQQPLPSYSTWLRRQKELLVSSLSDKKSTTATMKGTTSTSTSTNTSTTSTTTMFDTKKNIHKIYLMDSLQDGVRTEFTEKWLQKLQSTIPPYQTIACQLTLTSSTGETKVKSTTKSQDYIMLLDQHENRKNSVLEKIQQAEGQQQQQRDDDDDDDDGVMDDQQQENGNDKKVDEDIKTGDEGEEGVEVEVEDKLLLIIEDDYVIPDFGISDMDKAIHSATEVKSTTSTTSTLQRIERAMKYVPDDFDIVRLDCFFIQNHIHDYNEMRRRRRHQQHHHQQQQQQHQQQYGNDTNTNSNDIMASHQHHHQPPKTTLVWFDDDEDNYEIWKLESTLTDSSGYYNNTPTSSSLPSLYPCNEYASGIHAMIWRTKRLSKYRSFFERYQYDIPTRNDMDCWLGHFSSSGSGSNDNNDNDNVASSTKNGSTSSSSSPTTRPITTTPVVTWNNYCINFGERRHNPNKKLLEDTTGTTKKSQQQRMTKQNYRSLNNNNNKNGQQGKSSSGMNSNNNNDINDKYMSFKPQVAEPLGCFHHLKRDEVNNPKLLSKVSTTASSLLLRQRRQRQRQRQTDIDSNNYNKTHHHHHHRNINENKDNNKNPPPPPFPSYYENTFVYASQKYSYRYSTRLFMDEEDFDDYIHADRNDDDNNYDDWPFPVILTGTFSVPKNTMKRHVIRQTWGAPTTTTTTTTVASSTAETTQRKRKNQNLFVFVLAGDWKDIEEEFYTYHDILWLNIIEDYKTGLTPKTMCLAHFGASISSFTASDVPHDMNANTNTSPSTSSRLKEEEEEGRRRRPTFPIDFIFKTDDDMYANITQFRYDLSCPASQFRVERKWQQQKEYEEKMKKKKKNNELEKDKAKGTIVDDEDVGGGGVIDDDDDDNFNDINEDTKNQQQQEQQQMTSVVSSAYDDPIDFFGIMYKYSNPVRDPKSKYYIPTSLYSKNEFPVYGFGTGYIISTRFAKCVTLTMASMNVMWWEDVAIGILAERCHVKPIKSNWDFFRMEYPFYGSTYLLNTTAEHNFVFSQQPQQQQQGQIQQNNNNDDNNVMPTTPMTNHQSKKNINKNQPMLQHVDLIHHINVDDMIQLHQKLPLDITNDWHRAAQKCEDVWM